MPSHSPLTLSSDSESLHDGGSFSNEYKTDDEGSSPKSPKLYSNKSTAVGGSRAKSSSRKTAASPKIEDQTPSRRKKLDRQKEKKGTLDI